MATFGYPITPTELSLINRCREKDELAYFEFFKLYSKKIFKLAHRILGEEAAAEDALQETFLNILKGIKDFRGESKLSTWVYRIAINVCLGMLRKNKQNQHINLDSALESNRGSIACSTLPKGPAKRVRSQLGQFDPFTKCLSEEIKAQVQDILNKLDEKHRLVVRLHDLEGLTIEEIAKVARCPSGTVKSRLFYGRKVFKALFNQLYKRN